ncbi:MAG: ABC transporter ATP-binding protein [Magnetococcales bacterium]|nr:ABC transporter ATP-binding protein [Magnetococcales bacterium]
MMPAVMSETEETKYGSFLDIDLFARFFTYAKPYKGWIVVALLLLPISTVAQMVQPLIIKQAVDQHLVPQDLTGFNLLALYYAGLVAMQFFISYLQSVINSLLGQRVVRDIRRDLFNKLTAMDAQFFATNASGRLTNRITNDTEAVSNMVSSGLINLVSDILLLIGIAISMVILSPKLSLIALACMPIILICTILITRHMRLVQRKSRVVQAKMAGHLTEQVEGHEVLRLFNCQEQNRTEFDKMNSSYYQTVLKSNFLEAFQFSFIEASSVVVVALLFLYGAGLNPEDGVTVGVMVAFIDYLRRIFFPIRDLSGKFTTMQAAMTALERIFALLDTPPTITTPTKSETPKVYNGKINFNNVHFDYGKGPILKGVDCQINAGERVAVVGPTGAGKTSLIKLLNRTYDAQQGSIEINNLAVDRYPLQQLRKMVGMVQQETFLFAGTIMENIRLNDSKISSQDAMEAAKQSGAATFIEQLPLQYETVLSERGSNLSAGERQLIGITRMFAFKPEILVMDEATSSVDTISETLIQNALEKLQKNRTAIIIAHRLSTILNSDRILVLAQGEIKESGSHTELLAKDGLYAKLYALQFNDKTQAKMA